MPRIIVVADCGPKLPSGPLLLDEDIRTRALDDGEATGELIERVGQALAAAEEVERSRRAFAGRW